MMVNDHLQATPTGVPQGGPLSPLLANILLDDLDKELERRGHHFVRYADDFIIMVKSISAGTRVMVSIRRFLERELRLQVNEKKSKVAPPPDTDVLLETVAVYPYQSPESSQTMYFQKTCHLYSTQPKRAMASFQDHGNTSRYEQQMAI